MISSTDSCMIPGWWPVVGVCLVWGGVAWSGGFAGLGICVCRDPLFPHGYCCGQYASCWNAFLFFLASNIFPRYYIIFSGVHIRCTKKFYDWILEGTKVAVQKNKDYRIPYPYVMVHRSELPNLPNVNVPRSIPTATTDSTKKEGLDKAKSNKVQFKLISKKPKQFKTTRVKLEKPKVEKTPMEKEKEEALRKNTEMCIKALEYLQKGTLEDGELETNTDDENFDPSKYDLELSAEAHENENIFTDNVEINVKTGKHSQLPMRYDNVFMNKTDNQPEHNQISKHHK